MYKTTILKEDSDRRVIGVRIDKTDNNYNSYIVLPLHCGEHQILNSTIKTFKKIDEFLNTPEKK